MLDHLTNMFRTRKAQLMYNDGSSEIVSVTKKGDTYWVKGTGIQLLPYGNVASSDAGEVGRLQGWFRNVGWTGQEFK